MSPDKKLHWFYQHQWTREQVEPIRRQVVETFHRRFKNPLDAASRKRLAAGRPTVAQPRVSRIVRRFHHTRIYLMRPVLQGVERFRPASHVQGLPHPDVDDIDYYLSTSPVALPPNTTALEYWTKELTATPCLARMGLAYMSAPGKSVAAFFLCCSYLFPYSNNRRC